MGFSEKNTYSDICLSDIKPTLRNIRRTLWAIKEEFIFKRGKYNVIASQQIKKKDVLM
jgi:hypothetical protein